MNAPQRADPTDLSVLTGVRSGKQSYYRAYVRSDERLQRTVRAMDSISRALVHTVQGPRGLLEEVVRAAAAHLAADWTILALTDGRLAGSRPRVLAQAPDGTITDAEEDLPPFVRRKVEAVRSGQLPAGAEDTAWARVPMSLEGRRIGALAGRHGLAVAPESGDLSVLRILANQAAVSLHTSEQYQAGVALHRRAERLYDEAAARARDLEQRTRELRQAEHRLLLAHQRELVDAERHRIARELHDSVTQYVLSAGMALEVARGEAETLGTSAGPILDSVSTAKDLSQQAVEQLRRAIYALSHSSRDTVSSLPELLQEVAAHHTAQLKVSVRIEGDPKPLPGDADHEIARAVGEALFNVAVHANATKAAVRLRYRPDQLRAVVADDGCGDPTRMSQLLRLQRAGRSDGRHRGLANIEARLAELGGRVNFRRSRLGGVQVEMTLPLPITAAPGRAWMSELIGPGGCGDASAAGDAPTGDAPTGTAPPADDSAGHAPPADDSAGHAPPEARPDERPA